MVADDDPALDFIKDERRATTALSRARHGVILHGNLKTLCAGGVWRKFVLETLKYTKIVSPGAYQKAIRDGEPVPTLSIPLWMLGGTGSSIMVEQQHPASQDNSAAPSTSGINSSGNGQSSRLPQNIGGNDGNPPPQKSLGERNGGPQ